MRSNVYRVLIAFAIAAFVAFGPFALPAHVAPAPRDAMGAGPETAVPVSAVAAPAPEVVASDPVRAAAARDTGCVVVSLKRELTRAEARTLGLQDARPLRGPLLLVGPVPAGMTASAFAARLQKSEAIEYAEPDHLLVPAYSSNPNDPYFRDTTSTTGGTKLIPHAKSWGLHGVGSANFDLVWPALATDEAGPGHAQDVRVAVIDTGFYFADNVDLGGNIHAAIDECASYSPTSPDGSQLTTDTDVTPVSESAPDNTPLTAAHGTMTASEIGQATSNGYGSSGAAWDTRVDVYKVQGIATSSQGDVHAGDAVIPESAMIKAIYDAVDDSVARGYRLVINLSLVEAAGGTGSPITSGAIAYARANHTLVVAAVGNESSSTISYPAAYPGVIAVGASTNDSGTVSRSYRSNYGRGLDILAPGDYIWGQTRPGAVMPSLGSVPGYTWWSGTSMAAPYVSSAAALLLRVEPTLSVDEVESYIESGAAHADGPLMRDDQHGWGMLDAYASYRLLAAPRTTTDAVPRYAETATIDFTVTDRDSGLDTTTYFLLDDGWGVRQGPSMSTVSYYGGTPGYGEHELLYWSVDSHGVREDTHTLTFILSTADTTAPTTVSDAVESYLGAATIHLTPTDAGGAGGTPPWNGPWGVARTSYRVDGGAETSGTTVAVTAAGAHTLQFWSTDLAGNREETRIAVFTATSLTPLATKATVSRSASSVRRRKHIHLSGTFSPALAGDVIALWVKPPGSHHYTKAYTRSIVSIGSGGRGVWEPLTYSPKKHGTYYFRVVYSGDTSGVRRGPYTSGSVHVHVK